VGVPWLVLAGTLAWPRLDEFTLYSRGDDWLTYQVAAYRIYLQGYWLEAGERLFYYQPLYRWIAGFLHVIFGETSGGETFWDGVCLLVGGVLTFVLTRRFANARWALMSASVTMMLFTLTPIAYLIGRGLAEISAAAFAWTAALLLLHSHGRSAAFVIAAGGFATLAFYARLNHLIFAAALVGFLLPLDLQVRVLAYPRVLVQSIPWRRTLLYAAVVSAGLALFAVRTWAYTGQINPFAGTSFGLNYTGLSPATLLDPEVWKKVGHSLVTQLLVNEQFDPRGALVAAGVVAVILAIVQVPNLSTLPVGLAGAVVGAIAGAFVAHAHGYPGRFSVHLIPLAVASVTISVHSAFGARPQTAHRHDEPGGEDQQPEECRHRWRDRGRDPFEQRKVHQHEGKQRQCGQEGLLSR
jgi:hypothetical protein